MSGSSSGQHRELQKSLSFHAEGIPLLVSPQLLRLRNLGQIDLSRLKKDEHGWILEIGEVKSSFIGELSMARSQRNRLIASQRFLSAVFGSRSRLINIR